MDRSRAPACVGGRAGGCSRVVCLGILGFVTASGTQFPIYEGKRRPQAAEERCVHTEQLVPGLRTRTSAPARALRAEAVCLLHTCSVSCPPFPSSMQRDEAGPSGSPRSRCKAVEAREALVPHPQEDARTQERGCYDNRPSKESGSSLSLAAWLPWVWGACVPGCFEERGRSGSSSSFVLSFPCTGGSGWVKSHCQFLKEERAESR